MLEHLIEYDRIILAAFMLLVISLVIVLIVWGGE